MIRPAPLTEAHARALVPQPAQAAELDDAARVALILAQAQAGPSVAMLGPGGAVLCVGGVITDPGWPHRGIAWAVLAAGAGPYMRPLTREVRVWLDGRRLRRLEMYVDAQFTQGARWARMLGFKLETPLPMRHFLPNGNGAYLFGRV